LVKNLGSKSRVLRLKFSSGFGALFPKDLIAMSLVGVFYFAAARLSLTLAFVQSNATAFWPPAGIALAACLILGYRVWPGIFAGAFFVNLVTSGTVATSLGIATGNTLEALTGAALVTRFAHGRHAFDRAQDVFKFAVLAGLLATLISPTLGVTSLSLAGFSPWPMYGMVWRTWWLGDAGGMWIVAPLLILWSVFPRPRWNRRKATEALFLFLSLFLIGEAVFGSGASGQAMSFDLPFLCFPLLIWIAFRFGQRETITSVFLLSLLALWDTLHGFGPFGARAANEALVSLQIFGGVAALMSVSVSAVLAENRRAAQALVRLSASLETALTRSATDLSKAIEALDREVFRRKQVEDVLHKNQERFRLLVEGVKDYAIYMLDAGGRVMSWNLGAEHIKGYRAEEVLGWHFSCFYVPEDVREGKPDKLLRRAERDGRGEEEGWRLRKDGSRFWANAIVASLRDRTGHLYGYAKVVKDLTERRRLEKEAEEVRDHERRRIGRDLHDGLGQHLTGIAFMSRVLREKLSERVPEEAAQIGQVEDLVNQAIALTRDLARGLCPLELESRGFEAALQDLASGAERQFGILCVLRCAGAPPGPDFARAIHFYRIAQEAIRNAVQHGKAKEVFLDVGSADGKTTLRVRDDGIGFSSDSRTPGMGLSIMRSRAREMGASLDIETGPGRGTLITCVVGDQ